jgi:polysaccharide biosynthesis/export protein
MFYEMNGWGKITRSALAAKAWRVGGVLMLALLGGCALAPGMTFRGGCVGGTTADATDACRRAMDASRVQAPASTSGSTNASASNAATPADMPPAGALIEINGDLITKQRAETTPTVPADVLALFQRAAPYTLGPGDVLSIIVWDHPELNMPVSAASSSVDNTGSNGIVSGYTIDTGGIVQYAYVGPIKLSGLTELQARDLLAQKLGRYIRDPQVTLRIEAYRSRRIYLDGEVHVPGLQVMNDLPMTLPEAINRAGGFTANSDRARVAVTRGDATVMVNIPQLIDLVRVYPLNDSKVFVLGEVGHTAAVTFTDGRLSLNDALGYAGGVSQYSADASQVYVVRNRRAASPEIYHLDATSPAAMAYANDFQLRPNDVVFVDASSLVRWSRVVGMFLPSAQTLATGRSIAY